MYRRIKQKTGLMIQSYLRSDIGSEEAGRGVGESLSQKYQMKIMIMILIIGGLILIMMYDEA